MFYLVHAGSSLQVVRPNGAIYATLTPPAGVTISSTRKAKFAVIKNRVVIFNAPSQNIWLDPLDFTLHLLAIARPTPAPTAAIGAAGALTGAYSAKVSFIEKSGAEILNQSPLSEATNTVTLSADELDLTSIPVSTNPDVTGRRLYRTKSGGTEYFFWADIDDNVATTFSGDEADESLGDLAPELGNAPAGTTNDTYVHHCVVWKSRIFISVDVDGLRDNVYWCEIDTPWAWPTANSAIAASAGEDEFGITGFMPRRDELGIGKRSRISRLTGTTNDDFQIFLVSEETGLVSEETVKIIRDTAHFLGNDGKYTYGSQGVQLESSFKVHPWFTTDRFFNRQIFENAFAGVNPVDNTYDLHVPGVGSTVIDRWVTQSLEAGQGPAASRWLGPHLTNVFTPTCRTAFRNGPLQTVLMGGDDGYLYVMNQLTGADAAGAAPGTPVAIPIDWITIWLNGGNPDVTHLWMQPTFIGKDQGPTSTPVTATPRLGNTNAVDAAAQSISCDEARDRLSHWGVGELLRVQFTHAAVGDVELYMWAQPFIVVGRR